MTGGGLRQYSRTPVSGTLLKWIALTAMLIDHIAAAGLIPDPAVYLLMRRLGRIAFPVFCFLSAEALEHSRDPMKYAGRLFLFALISEAPFELCIRGGLSLSGLNVLFTLAGAAFPVALYRRLGDYEQLPLAAAAAVTVLVLAELLHTDYGAVGILLIWLFYGLRRCGRLRVPGAAALMLMAWQGLQSYALLALPLLLLYNGERGGGQRYRYFFYVFYPLHLTLLWLLRVLAGG